MTTKTKMSSHAVSSTSKVPGIININAIMKPGSSTATSSAGVPSVTSKPSGNSFPPTSTIRSTTAPRLMCQGSLFIYYLFNFYVFEPLKTYEYIRILITFVFH